MDQQKYINPMGPIPDIQCMVYLPKEIRQQNYTYHESPKP